MLRLPCLIVIALDLVALDCSIAFVLSQVSGRERKPLRRSNIYLKAHWRPDQPNSFDLCIKDKREVNAAALLAAVGELQEVELVIGRTTPPEFNSGRPQQWTPHQHPSV